MRRMVRVENLRTFPRPSSLLLSISEVDRHQRATRQPGLEILGFTQVREDPREDRALLLRVGDRGRASGNVGSNALLEVKREVGVRKQVSVPVAPARRTGQVDLV